MPVDVAAKFREWREHPAIMVRDLFGVEPDPWQLTVLEAFPHKQRIAMPSAKGPGKAENKNTTIPTPYGDRLFGDLCPGDWVFTVTGSATQVTAVHDRGVLPVYKVSFDDGSSVRVCGEHLWQVRGANQRRKPGRRWITLNTDEILRRGVRVKNGRWAGRQWEIPRHGSIKLPPSLLPLDPYLLGVWLGDGCRSMPTYMKPYVEVEHEINRRGYRTSRTGRDNVRILGALDLFRQIECFDCGSHDRFIPKAYLWSSAVQREDLLCGLMDTDGCIGDDSHMEYDTTSKRLAEDVVWLTRSLGGVAFIKDGVKEAYYHDPEGERVECRDCYRVTVRTPFNPFRIRHKAERWKNPAASPSAERYLKRYIDAIEPDGYADCMCIEVDHPSKLYLTNDFIVTHNSCVEAWIAWNFLLTRINPKVAATSISGDNLRDGLWTEMAKWQQGCPLLQQMFQWTTTRIFAKENPEQWWMSARTWPQSGDSTQQANTLAGLHADNILFIIDESGGMTDAVMVSAEAALSSCKEGHIVQAGNPTQLSGPLYRAHRNENGLWFVVPITGDPDDPNRSPRIDVKWARQMIAEYGADNMWVRTNVFGEFPQAAFNSLIGADDVRAAMKRYYREFEIGGVPRILGVDVADFGDDSSVIAKRQGIQMFPFKKFRQIGGPELASIIVRDSHEWRADAVFVDHTGGYGGTVIDRMGMLGERPIGIKFNSSAHDKEHYENKRAEMYFEFAQWIRNGGALPDDEDLFRQLVATTYTIKKDAMQIEPKEMIKKKLLGKSPDEADAAILTFAEPVTSKAAVHGRVRHSFSWEPFAEVDNGQRQSYDPFGGGFG